MPVGAGRDLPASSSGLGRGGAQPAPRRLGRGAPLPAVAAVAAALELAVGAGGPAAPAPRGSGGRIARPPRPPARSPPLAARPACRPSWSGPPPSFPSACRLLAVPGRSHPRRHRPRRACLLPERPSKAWQPCGCAASCAASHDQPGPLGRRHRVGRRSAGGGGDSGLTPYLALEVASRSLPETGGRVAPGRAGVGRGGGGWRCDPGRGDRTPPVAPLLALLAASERSGAPVGRR